MWVFSVSTLRLGCARPGLRRVLLVTSREARGASVSARPLHQHVTERRRHDHSPPARQIQIESSNFPACLSCNLNPPLSLFAEENQRPSWTFPSFTLSAAAAAAAAILFHVEKKINNATILRWMMTVPSSSSSSPTTDNAKRLCPIFHRAWRDCGRSLRPARERNVRCTPNPANGGATA